MTGKLDGKVALVTGASRGIGRAIAERLAADGAKVALNYSASAAAVTEAVEAIRAAGGEAIAVQADISDIAQGQALVDQTVATFGPVDILVNNAGKRIEPHPLLVETTPEAYDDIFGLMARGLFFVSQAAVKVMPDGGRIINISSASTTRKMVPGLSIYAGAKSAVEAWTRVWCGELAGRGITVNAILPGGVETDMTANHTPEFLADLRSKIPMGRLAQPRDIADVAAFLASDDARWLTGLTILATGGA